MKDPKFTNKRGKMVKQQKRSENKAKLSAKINIRKAKFLDAPNIANLIKKNVLFVKENNYSKKEADAWIKVNNPEKIKKDIQNKKIFVAEENGKILGTIGLNKNEICGFYMDPKIRGKGLGSKLFDFIQGYARKTGKRKLVLSSSPSALNFYKKRGFVEKGPNKYKVNEEIILPEVWMEKPLK